MALDRLGAVATARRQFEAADRARSAASDEYREAVRAAAAEYRSLRAAAVALGLDESSVRRLLGRRAR